MKTFSLSLLLAFTALPLFGEALDSAAQSKVDAQVKIVQQWAAEPAIVNAVKTANGGPSGDLAAMTDAKWKTLSVLDPVVRAFTKNATAEFIKSKKTEVVSEAFLSAADGTKVAFLTKPTSWSHKGKPKHEEPMAGKNWQGLVEVDDSTGLQQIQVSVPVLDGGKPIGSFVVGLSLSKLN